ncbi:MAG: hypothetical protein KA354_04120 [Phycisphaerae bacterium]|nr:hypothetical protein [Phycisphaerae bacterium]
MTLKRHSISRLVLVTAVLCLTLPAPGRAQELLIKPEQEQGLYAGNAKKISLTSPWKKTMVQKL